VFRYLCLGTLVLYAALAGFLASRPVAVRTAQAAAPPTRAVKKPALVDLLYQKIDYPGEDDPKTTLGEALERLAKKYQVSFEINERAFKYEMINDVQRSEVANPNVLPPMKARLSFVLERILGRIPIPSGATWLVRSDHVEITSWAFARQEIGLDRLTPANPLDDEVNPPPSLPPALVHIDLEKRPLAEALDALADRTGWNIVLDTEAARGKEKVTITARLRNAPLDTAVRVVASIAGLSVVELDNVLFVSTREKTAALRAEQVRARTKPGAMENKPFADD
jgi:hypothetical protein